MARLSNGGMMGALLLVLTGCSAATPKNEETTLLNGTSSTFAGQAYLRWFNQLAVKKGINAEITMMGSGQSIRTFLSSHTDFAGTDSPPAEVEIDAAHQGMLAFPVTAGAIAVAYNLPGCRLQLSRSQLVDLFKGRITNFSQLGCRNQPVVMLHRADASGSTANFTSSLAAISLAWRTGPGAGRKITWPTGRAVQGSDAMGEELASTEGAVGYIESAYVREPIQAAALQNRQGRFALPTATAAAQAISYIKLDSKLLGSNADPASGYPIVNLNWMLVPRRGLGDRREPLRTSLRYILSRAGQDEAELLGYVPLPLELRERALKQLDQLNR